MCGVRPYLLPDQWLLYRERAETLDALETNNSWNSIQKKTFHAREMAHESLDLTEIFMLAL